MNDKNIENVELKDALQERYLAYALSTIMGRALPDVRDGLKPVHRRIVHTMNTLRLNPNGSFAKCARIVGEVMGKLHPHGDQAIYDALVRLSQDFSQRYPLVDGQGNFGNIDGDNAAAMRYTEARMNDAMPLLLEGLREDSVDFRPTYNEEDEEPVVMPAAFPNLLANGSSGIAVGMATMIPPHNAEELCDAALHLIKRRNAGFDTICKFIKGPDFPTGGVIVEAQEEIIQAYKIGKGSFRVRAKWEKEELNRGTWQIVITQIPYMVQKSKLIEKTAELLLARKLPMLVDIRDESAEDIRIVLEPRNRTVDAEMVMEQLFQKTDFETKFPMNLNVLSKGKIPKVLNLRECLLEWLDHRQEVLVRRAKFRLQQIDKRMNVLEGYLIVYASLDEVIAIIRHEDEPKKKLMKKFKLNEVQVEAILNIRLRALHKLEEIEIKKEYGGLKKEKKELKALLKDQKAQWGEIGEQIKEIKKLFSKKTEIGKRRTEFGEAPDVNVEALEEQLVVKEPVSIVISKKGWVRAMRGHIEDTKAAVSKLSFKEGDGLWHLFHAQSTDRIVWVSTSGRFYTLGADRLPSGRGHGEPLRIMIDMENDADLIAAFVYQPNRKFLIAATSGHGFIVNSDDVIANTRKGKKVLNVSGEVEALVCVPIESDECDSVAVIGKNKKLLIFPLDELPEMAKGKGVKMQSYAKGSEMADAKVFDSKIGLQWSDNAKRIQTKKIKELSPHIGNRAQSGRVARGMPKKWRKM